MPKRKHDDETKEEEESGDDAAAPSPMTENEETPGKTKTKTTLIRGHSTTSRQRKAPDRFSEIAMTTTKKKKKKKKKKTKEPQADDDDDDGSPNNHASAPPPAKTPTKHQKTTKKPKKKQPTPKQKKAKKQADSTEKNDDTVSAEEMTNEEELEEQEEEEEEEEEATPSEPQFDISEKVLARDQDGLLYQAFIRRRLYGFHHHKQVQVGMVQSHQEMEEMLLQNKQSWHYFVHYAAWKPNWDRWVEECDILPWTDENQDLAKRILQEHKAALKEFKGRTKSRKVTDGGTFLKFWKQKLDAFMQQERNNKKQNDSNADDATNSYSKNQNKKKKNQKSLAVVHSKAKLEKMVQLQLDQSLTTRQSMHAQQISMAFGLKRILVEDWEIISQFQMVHHLPAKVTIRQALHQYIAEKGVVLRNENKNKNDDDDLHDNDTSTTTPVPANQIDKDKGDNQEPMATAPTSHSVDPTDTKKTPVGGQQLQVEEEDEETVQRHKEWKNMADGICMFFDQALPFRLLYPSEQVQLTIMEKNAIEAEEKGVVSNHISNVNHSKADIYGCEHLLRLFCQLPSLLADHYHPPIISSKAGEQKEPSREQEEEEERQEAAEECKQILAKVNDLCRFLQKHQDQLFAQSYRKKNDEEIKYEQKVAKRHERKRKQQQQQQLLLQGDEEESEDLEPNGKNVALQTS